MLYVAYTREDGLFTIQLVEDLQAAGVEVWLDINEIPAGTDWETAQQAAIEASEGLIVVLSPEAMKRDHMRREIQRAFDRRKPIYLAVARRSPWRDWLNGLPVADFTESYEMGLNGIILSITGGNAPNANEPLDEADRWLRQAAQAQAAQTDQTEEETPRKSFLSRLLKR